MTDFKEIKKKSTEKNKATSSKVKWDVLKSIIKDWNVKIRFSELLNVMEHSIDGGEWQGDQKFLISDIIYEMEVNRGVTSIAKSKVEEMICSTNICDKYNPISLFFNNLPRWNGKDNFNEVCKTITLDRNESPVFFENMLKKHLIRAVKCALEPDYTNRMVFTLFGAQEKGKSHFIKWLSPKDCYSSETVDPSQKDSILSLARYLILNMEELDGLNKKEVSKLKAFISKQDIVQRIVFGKHDRKFIRIASLFASTNSSDILVDTSNTRWLFLKVKDFDWKQRNKNLDPLQLWAQAKYLYEQDSDSGELTIEEKQERESRNNNDFLVTSKERELIMKYFDEGTEPMTSTDIQLAIEEKHYSARLSNYKFIQELKRIFGEPEKTSINGKSGRYYYVSMSEELRNNTFDRFSSSVEVLNSQFGDPGTEKLPF